MPREDPEAAALLHEKMIEDGVDIMFETRPVKFSIGNNCDRWSPKTEIRVEVESDDLNKFLSFNAVLIATGRTPNVENMGLEAAGVKFCTKKGVHINDKC